MLFFSQLRENLILTTLPSNEGSGEPAHMHRLTRVFLSRIHSMDVDEDSDQTPDLFVAFYLGGGAQSNSADPDQPPRNAATDQGLHCLLPEYSMNFLIKKYHPKRFDIPLSYR